MELYSTEKYAEKCRNILYKTWKNKELHGKKLQGGIV